MSEAKHTPGAWEAHGPVVTTVGSRIAQTHFGDNGNADARLIAAAPDLLSSLSEFVAALVAGAKFGLNEAEVAMLRRGEEAIRKAVP